MQMTLYLIRARDILNINNNGTITKLTVNIKLGNKVCDTVTLDEWIY
jgi:hypothetical protein